MAYFINVIRYHTLLYWLMTNNILFDINIYMHINSIIFYIIYKIVYARFSTKISIYCDDRILNKFVKISSFLFLNAVLLPASGVLFSVFFDISKLSTFLHSSQFTVEFEVTEISFELQFL